MDPYNYQRMYPQWYGQQPLPSMQPSMQPGGLPQPIQKVNQSSEEQAVCYFVKSPEEVASIKALPFTWYLGINENAKDAENNTWPHEYRIISSTGGDCTFFSNYRFCYCKAATCGIYCCLGFSL